MAHLKSWASLVLAFCATSTLAMDCEGSVACGLALIPGDCEDAGNKIDEAAEYPPNTRIRSRTCLIEYTCPSGHPIGGADLKGYLESVTSSCSDTCGDIEPSACPGGNVSIDYTTKNKRTNTLDANQSSKVPRELMERAGSHNNCDGSFLCGTVEFTGYNDDCDDAINAINTGINYAYGTDLSKGHCLMRFECDPALGYCGGAGIGGDVVQGACGRAFNECGDNCGSRTIAGNDPQIYCRVDYRG